MKIALLQLNFIVADLEGNSAKIKAAVQDAASRGAELCVTSELAVSGYPPRDLLLNRGFVDACEETVRSLAAELMGLPPVLVGYPEPNRSSMGKPVYNSVALLDKGEIQAVHRKALLPTYDVFDENRYFEPGNTTGVVEVAGKRIGVTVCEDIWNDKDFWQAHRLYSDDPVEHLARRGVSCFVNLSASPFTVGKQRIREKMLSSLALKYGVPVAYCNQVGGNDDLIFAGKSMVFGADGCLVARAEGFSEDIVVADIAGESGPVADEDHTRENQVWKALVLGTRDYARKTGFSRALLGLSGGIDSALTAAVATEALGPENVTGVLMPSPYSSEGSIRDSETLAQGLGINTWTLPIKGVMDAFSDALAEPFAGCEADVTEENIQSRIRGNLLMAISNKRRSLLLTTGNKSELAVGYCTIYGDMSGGLAVISDVPKTLVFSLCRWLNDTSGREVIPEAVISKPPSAELRPDQKDEDSLPPYEILDPILERRIEKHQSLEEIVAAGYDRETVSRVLGLVKVAEFKRRQAAPGIKITDRAFGTGWRMPIACKAFR